MNKFIQVLQNFMLHSSRFSLYMVDNLEFG